MSSRSPLRPNRFITEESELPKDHAAQEPFLLLRAQFRPDHHLPSGRRQQSSSRGQKSCEFHRVSNMVGQHNEKFALARFQQYRF